MSETLTCEECRQVFVRKDGRGRKPRFCSRACYEKKYYRHPDDTRDTPKDAICGLCHKPFVKIKRHQRYCCRECYEKAWPKLNRKKHNAIQKQKRIDNPEWFAEREPIYARTYRAKRLSSRPWSYLLQSARNRAKEKGWVFDLSDEWACSRWTGRCEITNIAFQTNGKRGPQPFSASIDRKDSTKGYTQENTRFILWGCNAIKGVGTDDDMWTIAKAIVSSAHTYSLHARLAHSSNNFVTVFQTVHDNNLPRSDSPVPQSTAQQQST